MTTSTSFVPPFALEQPVRRSRERAAALNANAIAFVTAFPRQVRDHLRIWNSRLNDRAYLAGLQHFELSEMGMTLDERSREVNKPIWQA